MAEVNIGKITQIIGAVLDIKFQEGHLPEINEAIEIDNQGTELVVEVSQHLGDDTVRCIAMGPTDGLVRGMQAKATGAAISVPVGENTLGRIFNVLGEPIDGKDAPKGVEYMPIHRKAPNFEEQAIEAELLPTGIKVVDLLCPYPYLSGFYVSYSAERLQDDSYIKGNKRYIYILVIVVVVRHREG